MRKNRNKCFRGDREKRSGFTLIEVMIVLFILIILASVSVLSYQSYAQRARKDQAKIFIESLATPLDMYSLHIGHYPTTQDGLHALLEPPPGVDPAKWDGPYIDARAAKVDPWGQPYNYMFPGQRTLGKYDLWSNGPDMIDGTEDDIGNWQ